MQIKKNRSLIAALFILATLFNLLTVPVFAGTEDNQSTGDPSAGNADKGASYTTGHGYPMKITLYMSTTNDPISLPMTESGYADPVKTDFSKLVKFGKSIIIAAPGYDPNAAGNRNDLKAYANLETCKIDALIEYANGGISKMHVPTYKTNGTLQAISPTIIPGLPRWKNK